MEKILVGLKRVVDYNVRVRVKSDGSGVETDGVKMSINPFDEIALEEALRIRERGEASEVIVVSIHLYCSPSDIPGRSVGAERLVLLCHVLDQTLDLGYLPCNFVLIKCSNTAMFGNVTKLGHRSKHCLLALLTGVVIRIHAVINFVWVIS